MPATSSMLKNAAKAAQSAAGKPKPMSADHTLYHSHPTGFWKTVHDALVVNPEISSGLPMPAQNRYPPPGSRPEPYATPATAASDPAFNPYWKRDTRRAYPQTSTITQSYLSELLLASPSLASLAPPTPTTSDSSAVAPTASASSAVAKASVPSLASVLEKLPAGQAFLGSGIQTGVSGESTGLPPAPPAKLGGKWVPKQGGEIPHDKDAYWPMVGYN
ncbi:hypothetical protein P7C73_g371, partial [Tremellales sp. Uapishka_1]